MCQHINSKIMDADRKDVALRSGWEHPASARLAAAPVKNPRSNRGNEPLIKSPHPSSVAADVRRLKSTGYRPLATLDLGLGVGHFTLSAFPFSAFAGMKTQETTPILACGPAPAGSSRSSPFRPPAPPPRPRSPKPSPPARTRRRYPFP